MFALRYSSVWIRRKDGLLTDDKERAKLFETVEEASSYAIDWKKSTAVHQDHIHKIEIVEVACRKVISKVGLIHEEI